MLIPPGENLQVFPKQFSEKANTNEEILSHKSQPANKQLDGRVQKFTVNHSHVIG